MRGRMWGRWQTGVFVVVVGLAASACAPAPDPSRVRWLRNTLVEDNLNVLRREPTQVEGKFGRMTLTPHEWLRGSLGQFRRDLGQRGPGYRPTAFGEGPAAELLLVGDPHLENIGTYASPDGEITIQFNDFDAANYGPWIVDVRRLATSVWLVAELAGQDGGRAAELVARAYAEQTQAAEPRVPTDAPGDTALLADALERGQEGLDENRYLAEYSEVDAQGRRRFLLRAFEPRPLPFVASDELVEVDTETRAALEAGLPGVLASLSGAVPVSVDALRVKDVARRLGGGVSSYPLLRYYAVVEGPTADPADDWLLEAKEAPDAWPYPGLDPARLAWRFPDNGSRIVAHQRTLHGRADSDFLLGHVRLGALSLRVRSLRGDQRGIDVVRVLDRFADGKATAADLDALFRYAAQLLAASHARGRTVSDVPAAPLLAAALANQADALAIEVRAFAEQYGRQTFTDAEHLRTLLEDYGLRLGFVTP